VHRERREPPLTIPSHFCEMPLIVSRSKAMNIITTTPKQRTPKTTNRQAIDNTRNCAKPSAGLRQVWATTKRTRHAISDEAEDRKHVRKLAELARPLGTTLQRKTRTSESAILTAEAEDGTCQSAGAGLGSSKRRRITQPRYVTGCTGDSPVCHRVHGTHFSVASLISSASDTSADVPSTQGCPM
jgi:hypothetical protein